MSINCITFSGNTGSDMEVRTTPSGKQIGTVNVATRQGWGDHERTTWIKVKVLGERAGKLAPYITKGCVLTVTGQFTVEEWKAKDGTEKRDLVCIADQVQLPPKEPQGASQGQPAPAGEEFSDDIPF